jgi:hypothetical protein
MEGVYGNYWLRTRNMYDEANVKWTESNCTPNLPRVKNHKPRYHNLYLLFLLNIICLVQSG